MAVGREVCNISEVSEGWRSSSCFLDAVSFCSGFGNAAAVCLMVDSGMLVVPMEAPA